MTAQDELSGRCREIANLSREALTWINDPENEEQVSLQKKDLTTVLRKSARRAERLGRASQTKMSVSVFGPSQAGKSFLVSVLARPNQGRLVADFQGPDGKLDYISQVNPAGDGESTGLVTRFTMTKAPTPEGFPIQLNLLTEADIAKTIINSFYEDGDQSEEPPSPESIGAHFANCAGLEGPTETGGLDFEEVYEIQEYVDKSFGKTAYAAGLKGFWDEAADLAPRMSPADRGTLFSILWGGYPPLTELYVKLARALSQVSNAEVVYAPLSALHPRETSIIDVNTLHGLFQPESEDLIDLRTGDGTSASLNRAIVTALAAELVFPMETQPSPFFSETDLLDFPGARNRFENPLSVTLKKPEETVVNLLLRGKVAYLFDRYVANQEITSMLLCIPDSNMETLSLPNLVEQWIELTHGSTPAERAKTDCILFFVLTKFDKHLGDSASGGEAGERFERRMDASLLKGFGKLANSWVHQWSDAAPFQNCYWLRNPNYFVEGLLEYDAEEREVAIRDEKIERVAELRDGCLAAEAVQKHFKDPTRAWDAALTLNDGGVGYLVDELTKVCKPESKLRQIQVQLNSIAERLTQNLSPYYVSDDIEKRIEESRLAASEIIDGLDLTLSNHRFGAFLSALTVEQDAVQDRIQRVPSSIRITNAVASESSVSGATSGPAAVARPSAPTRPGRPQRPEAAKVPEEKAPSEKNAEPAKRQIRTMTPEAFQADTALDVWMEGLERFRDDHDMLDVFQISETQAASLVAGLIHGLKRTEVRDDMMKELKSIAFGMTVDMQAPPAAVVCAERINDFVSTLGVRKLGDAEAVKIPLADGSERRAFEERKATDDIMRLPAEQRMVAAELWTDWVFALEALFVANAKDGESGSVNIEQNMKLGQVLSGLKSPSGAPV
ncbi:MAG: virulence factor SrfC family protein [Pseudomonadota bacterium]